MGNSKTIFVTGGAGYVGAHGCKAFADAGWDVVVYDNLSRGWRDFVQWGELIEGDICDAERLRDAMAHTKPDAVAHLAALAYVGESVDKPAEYYRANSLGALNLLDAMRAVEVRDLVFSSTCATYGVPDRMPITEDCDQHPVNPYGHSKLFVEKMLADYDRAYGLRSVSLRYFNAAGADPDGAVGERHEPETHLIPLAIRAGLPGDYRLTVFGDDFATPDGSCIRDYIHVTDLADAHVRAIDYLRAGGVSDAFNLGTGTGTSVREVIAATEAVLGAPVRHSIGPRRPGDPGELVASADKASSTLGWTLRHSAIDRIICDAVAWQQRDLAVSG